MRCTFYLGSLIVLFAFVDPSESLETWLTADFHFNWTPPGVNLSVPTTARCDTINITWTPAQDGSPDPVPPYFLHVYTSSLTYPLVVNAGTFSPFEWLVAFPQDTLYQICMFDSKGRTGGCQDAYTVTPARNSSEKCADTFSVPNTLAVQGTTVNGPLTEYGWPDQCMPISLMAQNGTPPFTLTVAPSLHSPLNLTFNSLGPMVWTVTLGWGMRFWISLVDAAGATWAYGPLHSGGNGPTGCLHLAGNSLITQPSVSTPRDVSAGAAVGIALSALVFGILSTLASQMLLGYRRKRNNDSERKNEPAVREVSSSSAPGVEPYSIASIQSQQPVEPRGNEGEIPSNPATSERNDSHVYVVHHDAGGAPITIFTGGRDVQELPPHYTRAFPEPRPTHTPSASTDSAGRSSGARRPKMNPPLRFVSG